MQPTNLRVCSWIYSCGDLNANNDDGCESLRKRHSLSTPPQTSGEMSKSRTWIDQPDRIDERTSIRNRIMATSRSYVGKTAVTILSICACFLSSPAFGQSTTSTTDPEWRQSIEQVIESYIRSHPELIEQARQALETKRQEEEQLRIKQVVVLHQNELLDDPSSPVSGDPSGDVTVVEFFDYRCGFCKRVAESVTRLQKDDPRVRIVYKDFPILGDGSIQAAKAALASREQGHHQAFHEALLGAEGDLSNEQIMQIAKAVGIDTEKLKADMDNPKWLTIIARNRALAEKLSITGTPAFVVGHELVPGAIDLTALKDLVARVRTR